MKFKQIIKLHNAKEENVHVFAVSQAYHLSLYFIKSFFFSHAEIVKDKQNTHPVQTMYYVVYNYSMITIHKVECTLGCDKRPMIFKILS